MTVISFPFLAIQPEKIQFFICKMPAVRLNFGPSIWIQKHENGYSCTLCEKTVKIGIHSIYVGF